MRAIVFANGALEQPALGRLEINPDDLILAADAGLRHCRSLGLEPDAVLGDLDSLKADEIAGLHREGIHLIRYPSRKDLTDLELAVRYAIQRGANQIVLVGALGDRWDHSLANLMLAVAPGLDGAEIRLLSGRHEFAVLESGGTLEIEGEPGDTVSLIPIGGDARGITTEGLEYSLTDGTLTFGATRGMSNVLLENPAKVSLRKGSLICVVIHLEPASLAMEGGE